MRKATILTKPSTSKTKQSRYNQEMNAKAAEYIRGTLLGQLSQLFAAVRALSPVSTQTIRTR
jgi:hypothetical protein